jgi:RNA polymerase sigma factor (sigma-70 family)
MTIDATEAELVALARHGDEHAFATLAEQHRARLWSICLRVTGNRADAEDALQDALTAAWLHLGSFRSEARFGTWAYRIAANAALAVVRRRKDIPTDIVEELNTDGGSDFTRHVIDADRVNAALATLGVQFREALVLREYGDLSYEQIAAHQGVGVQTVKSRLNRARAALAQELAGDEG